MRGATGPCPLIGETAGRCEATPCWHDAVVCSLPIRLACRDPARLSRSRKKVQPFDRLVANGVDVVRSAILIACAALASPGKYMAGQSVIKKRPDGENNVRLASYKTARPWDGQRKHFSTYG